MKKNFASFIGGFANNNFELVASFSILHSITIALTVKPWFLQDACWLKIITTGARPFFPPVLFTEVQLLPSESLEAPL